MRFASLGSGSAGNALVVESGQTVLLLDCGFGLRETEVRLARLGLEAGQLAGILVTHEHDDHAGGVFKFAARHRLAVWITHGTLRAAQRYIPAGFDAPLHVIDSHAPFHIADIELHPFPVPHDASEPVQYVFGDGASKLGVLTDTGSSTPHIEAMLTSCHALMLECNHDLDMLMNGSYAWPLKQRISNRFGHLDNDTSANLLAKLDNSKLQHIVAAHLSEANNTPALAGQALASALGCEREWVGIASQAEGIGWRQIIK
jgi:phosphoribosyl 1,2-cyclic phosphodiesterase